MRQLAVLSVVLTCLMVIASFRSAHAVTYIGTDTDPMGIVYSATVAHVGGNLWDVVFTINTTGYSGTTPAYLDWVNLKISPQDPASVTNVSLPTGWSFNSAWMSAGKVEFRSADVSGPPFTGGNPESTDISIPASGPITFSYRVDLTGTELELDDWKWPYQARYIFEHVTPQGQKRYSQTIVSRDLTVIPEPASLLLFAAGLVAPLGAVVRRRLG